MTRFKDMLKYFRNREGLSQKDLAKEIGVSASTISMYEVGQREPDFEIEERIADFFNVSLDVLRGIDREGAYENAGRFAASKIIDARSSAAMDNFLDLTENDKEIVIGMIERLRNATE